MIGIGIITCNRPDFLKKLWNSLPDYIDHIIVVDDANTLQMNDIPKRYKNQTLKIVKNEQSKQVGECKNIAMRYLLDIGCDYIFTLEDDIIIKDKDVFRKYIQAYNNTGIAHMNFGFSHKENLDKNLQPVYRKVIEYPTGCKIILTLNILGAFTFYTKNALQTIGLHHNKFNKGHGDHPELTYRAYKHGYTTPFWWFADLFESWNMIENQSNMGSDSLVRNQEKFRQNFEEANNTFEMLHGYKMITVPDKGEVHTLETLKEIYKNAPSI